MKNLHQLFKQPLRTVPVSIVVLVLIVALIGFVDAGYLAVEHFRGVIPPCSLTGGCESVLSSQYSILFGIPVSLLGAIYYLVVLIGAFAYLESKKVSLLKWTLLLTPVGFAASLVFIYIQIAIIGSYCAYCLGSAITSTILFVIAMDVFLRYQD